MSAIRLATAVNVRGFQTLSSALNDSDGKWAHLIDYEGLQDEIGRFRVWSGNLGALQKGHSSLDYRLRDSPLLSSNALKFLKDLEDNINEAIAIVTEARLPYELQPKPEKSEDDEDEDDDGFFDKDEEEDENGGEPRSELSMRFVEVVDIVDNLYKLSVRIRTPTIRSRSLKAATYQPKDPDTGVDILSTYAIYDVQHVKELLAHLRQVHVHDAQSTEHDYVINRLSAAITLRRRQFKYWKRHRDKLGSSNLQEEQIPTNPPPADRPSLPQRNDTLEALPDIPVVTIDKEAPSQKTGRTLLSGTEATQHHQSLDEIVDTKSVTSYAVTVKDLHGRGVELPTPPRAADGEKDFECPYCYIICPARYGRGRAWRTHLLQDLQPYVCTYPECEGSEQLFRSRREWAEHEASHRKAWRCPEHTGAVYKSNAALEEHFRREHADSIPESQLSAIVKVGETTTVDVRTQCPICLAPADTEGLGDFHNHIANHLERIATFALPNGNEDESDGASSAASRGHSESSQSRNLSDLSLPTDASEDMATTTEQTATQEEDILKHESHHTTNVPLQSTGGTLLSAESLEQLPDVSDTRLETLFAGRTTKADKSVEALDSDTDDSVYLSSDPGDEMEGENATYLQVSDIPTLRSLYRSRRLLQRDQSFNPNDSYNQVISLCHHDLTKIKVDAIINGANRAMKFTLGETLNNAVHQAAGPGLSRETKTKGRLKKDAILTGGHRLPSKHIIHVLRPGYSNKSGMGQFNQLVDCYRNAFDMAIELELKTLAFPCLGTGGVGFPARVAARIVLQDVREYLDQHPEHGFERIVFCVNSAADEMAYIDFLPVFFPPTHGDLEAARSSVWSGDRATAALDALKARNEIQKVVWDLNLGFGNSVPSFWDDIISHFHAIDQALVSIRQYLLSSNEINNDLKDLRLLCSVMQLICGSVAETIELANDHLNLGQQNDLSIWADFVATMEDMHRKGPSSLLRACANFAQNLDTMITKNGVSVDEFFDSTKLRQILDRYKVKQRGGREADGTQDHLNEVLYTREFQRQTIAQSREHIKLHKIPTVTQLYKLGELEEKTTLARPSIEFNDKVCLVREDITKLEVDVMVNSADEAFEGIGALARTVFLKGGVQLQEAVQTFGKCEAGDVRLTPGYLLPAKNILHVIPPDQLRQDTKDIMRKIYREVLYRAVTLGAASIALPSIGTGLLNFPRRDCVSIALEETKRFLESSIPGSLIEKIVFVVYSSNDEFVYKSLLPVYFPPPDLNVNRALPASIPRQDTAATTSSTSSNTPRRNLFGSIGEAFRSLRPGKPSGASRPISGNEEHALINFESHAKDCETCGDVKRLYLEGRDLCKRGNELAKIILWHMTMHLDSEVYAFPPVQGVSTRIEVPTDMFPISLELLATVEKSQRDGDGSRPFVARDRSYGATSRDQGQDVVPPGVTIHSGEVQIPNEPEPKKARARVSIMNHTGQWDPALSTECQILVRTNSVDVFENIAEGGDQVPLMSHMFTSQSKVQRRKTTPEVELYGCPRLESRTYTAEAVLFQCRSDNECNALLRSIRQALDDFQAATTSDEQQQTPGPAVVTEQDTSGGYLGWNKRLKDIQNELSTMKRASGGLSDLQYKMERLGIATSSLNPGSQQDTDASRLYDTSRSPLATSILVLLTADLKSRPGSYIGLKTDRIVAELPATHDEVSSALQELVEQDQVHNTVDGDTWVISHPPKDLPVLSEGHYDQGQASREASPPGPRAEPGSSAARAEISSSSVENSKPAQATGSVPDSQFDQQNIPPYYVLQTREDGSEELVFAEPGRGSKLSATTAKVFAYLMDHNHESSDHAYPNHEIAAAVDLTTEEVDRSLFELLRLSIVHFRREDKTWQVIGSEAQKEAWRQFLGPAEAVEERSAPSLSLIQPSPPASDDGREADHADETLHTGTKESHDRDQQLEHPDTPLGTTSTTTLSTLDPTDRLLDSDYQSSPSGSIWTLIGKRFVYSKILIAAGEAYDDMGRDFLVHREVGWAEMSEWSKRSSQMSTKEKLDWDEEKRKWRAELKRKNEKELERELDTADRRREDMDVRHTPEPPGAERFPDSAYETSPSGTIWTRIDKSMAYSKVLTAAGEVFDDMGDYWLVHREVSKQDVEQWLATVRAMLLSERTEWDKEQSKGKFKALRRNADEVARNKEGEDNDTRQGDIVTRDPRTYASNNRRKDNTWKQTDPIEFDEQNKARADPVSPETQPEFDAAAYGALVDGGKGLYWTCCNCGDYNDYALSPECIACGHRLENCSHCVVYEHGTKNRADGPSELSDGLPSPTVPPPSLLSNDEIRRLGTDRLPDSDYFISLSGQAWTRVKKRHVASQILVGAHETFDDAGSHYLVYRAVGKSELMQWVLATHRLEGREKEKWEKEQRLETTYEEELPPAVTRWSVLAENADILRLGDDRLHYSDYYISPSDMIWTRVEKSRVYSGILVAANEEFSDNGSEFLVHRVAGKTELQRWAEETYSMAQADKDKWAEERKRAQEEKARPETEDEEHTEPVSQFSENDEIVRLGDDRLLDSDYYIAPTGLLWTRVKKIYVYSGVLEAANEDFSDSGSEFLVHRAAGKSDMQRWTENTQSMAQPEQEKWEEEQRQAREAMQMASGELYESFRKAWDVQRDGEQGAETGLEQQDQPESGDTVNPRLKVQENEDVTVRPASEFNDLPPSPTEHSPSAQDAQHHLDTQTLNEKTFSYASPSGARWTRVDKRLIDPRVLIASNEDFEDVGDELVVHRVLRRGEVDRWAQESIRTRATDTDAHGADYDSDWRRARAILGARRLAPSSETERGGLLHRDTAESRGDEGVVYVENTVLGERDGGLRGRGGEVGESPTVRQSDKGKGKGKERANERRDDRDEYQEKLDRVIAGDMREEDMRRFGDGDEERLARVIVEDKDGEE